MNNNTCHIPQNFSLFQNSLEYVKIEADCDLEQLRDKHIFLTGCTSFFGKWLIECLLWAEYTMKLGIRLTVLTRNANGFLRNMPHLRRHKALTLVEGDATTLQPNVVSSFQYGIHAVNLLYDDAPDWAARHMRTAVLSTENIMHLAAEHGCGTVLLASSGGAYGSQQFSTSPFSETSLPVTLDEPTIYGNTKRFLELFARALGREAGITVPVVRLFAFSGAYTPLIKRIALGSFIKNILLEEPIIITGDGNSIRTYLHACDMVIWTLAVLVRGGNEEYNIGSSHPVSIRQLATTVLNCAKRPESDMTILGNSICGNAPSTYIPTISHINSLGVKENFSLEESIYEMLKWYRLPIHSSFYI